MDPSNFGSIRSLQPIAGYDGRIIPVDEDRRIDPTWAHMLGYRIVTRDVPPAFAPCDAIIRTVVDDHEGHDVFDFLAEVEQA